MDKRKFLNIKVEVTGMDDDEIWELENAMNVQREDTGADGAWYRSEIEVADPINR